MEQGQWEQQEEVGNGRCLVSEIRIGLFLISKQREPSDVLMKQRHCNVIIFVDLLALCLSNLVSKKRCVCIS